MVFDNLKMLLTHVKIISRTQDMTLCWDSVQHETIVMWEEPYSGLPMA